MSAYLYCCLASWWGSCSTYLTIATSTDPAPFDTAKDWTRNSLADGPLADFGVSRCLFSPAIISSVTYYFIIVTAGKIFHLYITQTLCRWCGDSMESDTFYGDFMVKLILRLPVWQFNFPCFSMKTPDNLQTSNLIYIVAILSPYQQLFWHSCSKWVMVWKASTVVS